MASYYMSIQVQVLEDFHWTDTPPGTYQVSIMCCFCGKKHHHHYGAGKLVDGVLPPDSLGKRVPHCDERLCSIFKNLAERQASSLLLRGGTEPLAAVTFAATGLCRVGIGEVVRPGKPRFSGNKL